LFNWLKRKADSSRILGLDLYADGCALAVLDFADPADPTVIASRWCALEGEPARQLKPALRALDAEGLPVVATLKNTAYSLVQLEAPEMTEEEMREAMRWRVKDLVDFAVDDAVIDVFRLPKSRRPGAPDLVYVVVAKGDEVAGLADLLSKVDLRIEAIDIVEMAMRNLVLHLDKPQRPRAYLHLRPHDTVIEIADGPEVYLSRRVIQDLDPDADPELLQAQMESLALEVQRSLDYFESQYAMGAADQLAVMAHEDRLFEPFQRIANSFLTVPCVRFELDSLSAAAGVGHAELRRGMTAIGAALRRAA
jgi:MSHA biogenesis protein MshI